MCWRVFTAYRAGYITALQDVLGYLQEGLDLHQGQPSTGIAQVIDYIEVSLSGLNDAWSVLLNRTPLVSS